MRIFVWRNIVYIAMLSCLAAPTLGAATKKEPSEKQTVENVELLLPPSLSGQSVEVAVALYVTNFVAIDETKETFEVSGYLTAKWKDPRLALPFGATEQKKRILSSG